MYMIRVGIKYQNASEGCQKCTTTGQYCKKYRRMTFPHTNVPLRTDESFRARSIPDHHREDSILEELPINMIDDFVTSDSLHLFHLGIMKKCLLIWLGMHDKFEYKWTEADINEINRLLFICNDDMPSDIHRSVRTLQCIKFWKGTEFRTFLLYIGPVFLKSSLRDEEYFHFLKLYCAIVICSHERYSGELSYAEELFQEYFEEYISIYGIGSITSNVHNITHVINDVRRFGPLPKIDSYCFENCLYGLKLRLRTCAKPLEQISRRIVELDLDFREPFDFNNIQNIDAEPELKFLIDDDESTELHYQHISLGSDSFLSSRKFGDKWFLTKSDTVVEFHFAVQMNGRYFLNGSRIKKLENWFELQTTSSEQPFASSSINVYSAKYIQYPRHYYLLDDVKAKIVCLRHKNELVFMPLLHSLK